MSASEIANVNGHDSHNEPNGFGLAPGAERFHNGTSSGLAPTPPAEPAQDTTSKTLDYTVDFPSLPAAPQSQKSVAWGSVKSTTVTARVTFKADERANKPGKHLGGVSEEQQRSNQIAKECNVNIELSESRDQNLTILITGKAKSVEEARTRLLRELQTQTSHEINVPKEYRGILIGKEGSNLKKLEQDFAVKIHMPKGKDNNDAIRINGPPEFVNKAVRYIENKVNELAKQASETLAIPRNFYAWVRGPGNENIERWQSQYNVKVNIPPTSSEKETIIVNGEREGVHKVVAEIQKIYNSKKDAASITCNVPKAQHRYVLGSRRSGLDEILRTTGVIVDVPAENDNSDVLTLFGDKNSLADALSLVYKKATSIISREIKYNADWQRRYLIGPKGATLNQLVPNQDKLKIDFEDGRIIYLEGSPEQVNAAADSLQKEIDRLTKDCSSETIKIPVDFHKYIVGRNGALISKLKSDNDVQISIPDEKKGSDEIRIEGNKNGVKKVIASIKEIVKRVENEKSADVTIEQRFHGMLIGKHGENINKWRQEFPTVQINFPDVNNKSDIIGLRGDRNEVDKLASVIAKMKTELIEAEDRKLRQHTVTVNVPLKYHQRLIGAKGASIRGLQTRHEVNIRIPKTEDNSETITITGYETKANDCKKEIEDLISKLESMVTREIELDPRFHPRLIGQKGRNLRKIKDEFKCEVRLPGRNDPVQNIVVIAGSNEENVTKCCEQLKEQEETYLDELVERGQYMSIRNEPIQEHRAPQQVQIQGAPWQLDTEQFPAMGDSATPAPTPVAASGVWGNRRW